MPTNIHNIHIIANHDVREEQVFIDALVLVHAKGFKTKIHFPKNVSEICTACIEAVNDGASIIVAVGGDGTINQILNVLVKEDSLTDYPTIGILPAGTGNDFSSMCEIPKNNLNAAWEIILDPKNRRMIDIGKMNDDYFINLASCGYVAKITAETKQKYKDLLGPSAYALSGLFSFFDRTGAHFELEAPNFSWAGEAYAVCVANGRSAGGGFVIAPDAKINDGLFDILIVPVLESDEFLKLLFDSFRLKTAQAPVEMIRERVSKIKVNGKRSMMMNLDGESNEGKNFNFEIIKRCFPIAIADGVSILGPYDD